MQVKANNRSDKIIEKALQSCQARAGKAIDFSDFMGLIRVRPSGKIAATVVQTRPGQFATMPDFAKVNVTRIGDE